MLMSTLFLVSSFLVVVYGNDHASFSCPNEHVLAFVTQTNNEIDLNAAPLTICGEKRTCTYTTGAACAGKGNYVSGVKEVNGKITLGCCLVTPPVQDHQEDNCGTTLHIETTDLARISSPRPSPIVNKGNKPSGGGNGNGAAPPKEVVDMEVKSLPPGNPTQFVKAITKLNTPGVQGYSVTLCTPQCGRSTTTKRPSTPTPKRSEEKPASEEQAQQPPPPDRPAKKGLLGGHHCFSAEMTVMTPFGTKRMDQVRAGDKVMVTSSDSKPVFEPVEWLYHRDHEAQADFITVTTKSQRTLQLSANHLIPSVPCSNGQVQKMNVDTLANSASHFARRLKVGSCIATMINGELIADEVISVVQETKRGIYSPITNHGTIIVNDIVVSCYSSVENHLAQKTVHSALINTRRMVSKVWNGVFGSSLSLEDSNVPLPLQMLLKMAQIVVPSNVFSPN
jgi:hypothetical protein